MAYVEEAGKDGQEREKRLSVLEIIGTATRGGMEIYIANFLEHLPPGKFRITCICPCESPFTDKLRQLGVEAVYVVPLADDPAWRSIQTAIEVSRLHQADILHAHMPKSHVLAGIAGSLLGKPVLATLHGMHVTAHELGVARAVQSHLVTNCQETYIQALAMGIPSGKLHLYQNGVDIKKFKPGGDPKLLRSKIGLDANTPLVGFVGRLEYEKGPDLFVRAACLVHEHLPGVHFAIIGAGSMQSALKKMAGQQISKQLHFIDWFDDPSGVYPAFDLLAHCSRSDGTSLVMLEAMACGKPVVGMAVGGVREMISNECTGMQVEAGNWEAMGWQIVKLLQEPSILHSMGEAGRHRAETHFNVSINTLKMAQLLWDLASPQKSINLNSELHLNLFSNTTFQSLTDKKAG